MTGGYLAIGKEVVETASFDVVFSLHHDYVYGLVRALLGNSQDAEDVVQEVFLRVYKALPGFDPERASLRTWLTKIAVNACNTHRRRNILPNIFKRTDQYLDEGLDVVDTSPWGAPEDQVVLSEMRAAVRDVLAKLKPEHRTVLVLHYYLDLSCTDIAGILGCPEGTVYSRLHYARRLVQKRLERSATPVSSEVTR